MVNESQKLNFVLKFQLLSVSNLSSKPLEAIGMGHSFWHVPDYLTSPASVQ